MRTSIRFLLAAVALAVALPTLAQTPVSGAIATVGCGGILYGDVENAVLVGVKIPTGGACTDILFDLRETGGMNVGGADVGNSTNPLWLIPPNWKNPQVGSDDHAIFVIYPPATGTVANRVGVDSGTINNQDFTAVAVQTVGNSIPASYNATAVPPTQGIDLNLATTTYSVKLRGPTSTATAGFPKGANGGVEVAFAPLAEVNTSDLIGGGCSVAGETRNGSSPADPAMDGALLGYNVYRVAGTASTVPTATTFYTASLNTQTDDGWQYFMPLTQSFNLSTPDTNPGSSTPPAPTDMNPNDLGGLQNPDGTMSTGDEVMIFQDSNSNRGTARATGTGPVVSQGYWYAFQPVMCGAVSDFAAATGFGPGGALFNGMHASSVSALNASNDAIDLDLNGTIDFFSPQADAGLPGLGLMYNALPVLSEPVFGQLDPLAAGGQVTLTGHVSGSTVDITFQSGLEAGNVSGFNVYRGVGDARVRVNEQLILAQGTESSVYQLVDDAVQARRLSKGGTIQYTVDIVYADGHTSTVGPFTVTLDRQAPGRRSR